MHLDLFNHFIEFLKTPSLKYSELCSFLVHNILINYKCNSAIVSQVIKSGEIETVGSFGIPESSLQNWSKIKPNSNHPISKTLLDKKPVVIKTLPNWPKIFDQRLDLNLDVNYKTCLCFPITAHNSLFGTLTLFSTEVLKLSKHDHDFISLVANMMILRSEGRNGSKSYHSRSQIRNISSLNEREVTILELIKQGKTNAQIAQTLGYSESTIRQDTIKIYQKLGIAGRQEIHFLKEIS